MSVFRLILVNALIRVAAAASGQLFAFLIAQHIFANAGVGSVFVGLLGGCYFVAELVGAPVMGRVADARGQRRVLRYGPIFGAMLGVAATPALINHGAPRRILVLTIGCSLVESGFTPAALAHLADVTEHHDASRGAVLGLYSLVLGSGQLLGNAVGAPFAGRWQMDGVLVVTATLALVALAGVSRMSVRVRGVAR